MATAFISALANVPWGQVIDHAPKLVEQAQKLIANSRSADVAVPEPASATDYADLKARVEAMAVEQADLRKDLAQASELLGQLAQTNQLLVAKLTQWQSWFWGLAGISVAGLVFSAVAILR